MIKLDMNYCCPTSFPDTKIGKIRKFHSTKPKVDKTKKKVNQKISKKSRKKNHK